MKKNFKILYGIIAVILLVVSTIGATYAYLTASVSSLNNTVHTNSTIYSISMDISSLYSDFSFIPMNDSDALKGLSNKCLDKYERGACSAYRIHVYGYNENLDYISGYMEVSTNNMDNLSYMVLRKSNFYDDSICVNIDDEYYCITHEATSIKEEEFLSLGSSYDVLGQESADFILMFWLTNLDISQNDFDLGSFNSIVTIQAGNGGQIKGTIASAVKIDSPIDENNKTEG